METLAEMARKEIGPQPAQSPFTPWLLTTLISSETRPLGAVPVSAIALACRKGLRSDAMGVPSSYVYDMYNMCNMYMYLNVCSYIVLHFSMNILEYRQISPSIAIKIFFHACTRVRSTSNGKTTAQVKSAAEAPAVAVWRAVRLSGIMSRNVPWPRQSGDKVGKSSWDHSPVHTRFGD